MRHVVKSKLRESDMDYVHHFMYQHFKSIEEKRTFRRDLETILSKTCPQKFSFEREYFLVTNKLALKKNGRLRISHKGSVFLNYLSNKELELANMPKV